MAVNQVWKFFQDAYPNLRTFSEDWKALPEKDREDIRKGIEDGTLTY